MAEIITHYPQFFTAIILEWKMLLKPDKYKEVIIESMHFLVTGQRVIIYGFVIMDNHLHVIWQMKQGRKREEVQRDFLKHTAQEIKEDMLKSKSSELNQHLVNAKDANTRYGNETYYP